MFFVLFQHFFSLSFSEKNSIYFLFSASLFKNSLKVKFRGEGRGRGRARRGEWGGEKDKAGEAFSFFLLYL